MKRRHPADIAALSAAWKPAVSSVVPVQPNFLVWRSPGPGPGPGVCATAGATPAIVAAPPAAATFDRNSLHCSMANPSHVARLQYAPQLAADINHRLRSINSRLRLLRVDTTYYFEVALAHLLVGCGHFFLATDFGLRDA